jgi:hypothetical protein
MRQLTAVQKLIKNFIAKETHQKEAFNAHNHTEVIRLC